MSPLFLTTYVLLWVLVIVLTLLVLLLYRQYGQAVLPAKARMQLAGLDIGKPLPEFDVLSPADGPTSMHAVLAGRPGEAARRMHVLLFASPVCPVCESLWPDVGVLAVSHPDVAFWWVSNGTPAERPHGDAAPPGWTVLDSSESGQHPAALELPVLPYAYAVDDQGVIRAKGLMNEVSDFEHMIDIGLGGSAAPSLALLDAGSGDAVQREG